VRIEPDTAQSRAAAFRRSPFNFIIRSSHQTALIVLPIMQTLHREGTIKGAAENRQKFD
jgi:hypothetical protein